MANTRNQIFDIIEKDSHNSIASKVYDVFMLVVIILSIIPLMFTVELPWFKAVDKVTTIIFIIDYVLRWITADLKLNKKGWSFVLYPITWTEPVEPCVQDIQVVKGVACVPFA